MNLSADPSRRTWHPLLWAAAAALLCVPAIAMGFTEEVRWTALDFLVAGLMLAAACGGFELLVRAGETLHYRLAAAATVLGLLFLVWVNLAVGIIGSEQNNANLLFALVIGTVIGGACLSHLRPWGMSRTLLAAAAVQSLIALLALLGHLGAGESANWPKDVLGCTAILLVIWLAAAALFARAARR